MSLIQQALEKTEQIAREADVERAVRAVQNTQVEVPEIRERRKSGRFFSIMMVLGFGALFFLSQYMLAGLIRRLPQKESRVNALQNEALPVKTIEPVIRKSGPQNLPADFTKRVGPLEFPSLKPKFKLSGITISGGQPLALINNQVAAVGDTLKENVIVKKIDGQSVTIEQNGKEISLTM